MRVLISRTRQIFLEECSRSCCCALHLLGLLHSVLLFPLGRLLYLGDATRLCNLAGVLVDSRRIGVGFLHFSLQVFLFRLLLPVHLLHLLVVGSLEVIHVHLVGCLVD